MAEIVVTLDELAMRRRARRRLVGAVAIALTSVVVLPMLFDSEPKPLGPEVDIRIPAQDSAFDAMPAVKPAVPAIPEPSQPEARIAEPTQPAAAVIPQTVPSSGNESVKPVAVADDEKARPHNNPPASPSAGEKVTKAKPEPKPEPKQPLKPDISFASQGYFLQLGAFGNESYARQLQDKAIAAGFKVVMVGTNGQFRVRVGPIPQHERAMEIQAKLKAKGFSPVLIGP